MCGYAVGTVPISINTDKTQVPFILWPKCLISHRYYMAKIKTNIVTDGDTHKHRVLKNIYS